MEVSYCASCRTRVATVQRGGLYLCAICAHDELERNENASAHASAPSSPDLDAISRLAQQRQASYLRAVQMLKESLAARDDAVIAANHAGIGYDRLARLLDVPKGTVQSIMRKRQGGGSDDETETTVDGERPMELPVVVAGDDVFAARSAQ